MENIFLYISRLSLTGCIIIPIVMAVRLLLKRFPRIFSYWLWAPVFISLIFSFQITLPQKANVYTPVDSAKQTVIKQYDKALNSYSGDVSIYESITPQYAQAVENGIEPIAGDDYDYVITAQNNAVQAPPTVKSTAVPKLYFVWILGFLSIFTWFIVSTVKLYGSLQFSHRVSENIFTDQSIASPFVFGFFKPKIYIPENLNSAQFLSVTEHEKVHIRRFDYIVKPLCFAITALHWFNPLVWLAYNLMCRDMEMSCDEAVIEKLGSAYKKDYSLSLLSFASTGTKHAATLLFGESGIENRIKNILNFKSPQKYISLLLTAAVLLTSCGLFIKNPETVTEDTSINYEEFYTALGQNSNLDNVKNKFRSMVMTPQMVDMSLQPLFDAKVFPSDIKIKGDILPYEAVTGVRIDDTDGRYAFVYLPENDNTSVYKCETDVNGNVLNKSAMPLDNLTVSRYISYDDLGGGLNYTAFYSKNPDDTSSENLTIVKAYPSDTDSNAQEYEIYSFSADEMGKKVRGLRFFNENLGFMAQGDDYSALPMAKLTFDGGKSWQSLDFSKLIFPALFSAYRSCCIDIYGDEIQIRLQCRYNDSTASSTAEPYYLISDDCGKSWAAIW